MLRPQGMPLEVGGPPARGRVALPRDRKVCHWKSAGRPQGVPLPVGGPPERDSIFQRADQDRQDSQDLQDMAIRMLAHLARAKARLPQDRQSSALRTSQAHSWGSWKSCSSWPRRQSREAAWRLPRPPARPPQLAIGNIGNWQHLHIGNIPHHAPLRATPGKSAVLANRSRP